MTRRRAVPAAGGLRLSGGRRLLASGCLLALLCGAGALAQTERMPLAGEAYTGTAFGKTVSVAERDRTRVTEIGLGFQWIPDGLEKRALVPSGGLYFWRNADSGQSRLRAVLSGLYDDIRYARRLGSESPWEAVATFENTTLPFIRSEYVEGERIASEELKWGFVRAGAGLGYRRALAPGHQDNAFEAAITYEPGYLFFSRGDDTAKAFLLPRTPTGGDFTSGCGRGPSHLPFLLFCPVPAHGLGRFLR